MVIRKEAVSRGSHFFFASDFRWNVGRCKYVVLAGDLQVLKDQRQRSDCTGGFSAISYHLAMAGLNSLIRIKSPFFP
jgi:hypothetical protein